MYKYREREKREREREREGKRWREGKRDKREIEGEKEREEGIEICKGEKRQLKFNFRRDLFFENLSATVYRIYLEWIDS